MLSLAACLAYLFVARGDSAGFERGRRDNAIVQENKQSGSGDWWLPLEQEQRASGAASWVLGFATQTSVAPGGRLEFKVDNAQSEFSLRIYRLGYYGGLGARLVGEGVRPKEAGVKQEACLEVQPRTIDCSNWNSAAAWDVPSDAVSGVYVGIPFIDKEIKGSYMPFVVRPSLQTLRAGSGLLFKTSDLTWVAYNMYGGWNVYTRTSDSLRSVKSRARTVSYNRPLTLRFNLTRGGKHQNNLFGSEYAAIRWLEKHGYDVTYASCADMELYHTQGLFSPSTKNNSSSSSSSKIFRALLSVGHDEYWTSSMRSAFEDGRNAGIHLVFWSGNEVFWRVRWGDAAKRIVVAKKETLDRGVVDDKTVDKGQKEEWTGTFGDPRYALSSTQAQNSLTGQLFGVNGLRHDELTVSRPEEARLRFWRNTTVQATGRHETARGILGYEWDVFADDCARPPGLVGLSSTTKTIHRQLLQDFGSQYNGSGEATHRLTLYRHPASGALVFGAGTVQWAWALSPWHDAESGVSVPPDVALQQASVNILADMGVHPSTPRSPIHAQSPSSDLERPESSILHVGLGSAGAGAGAGTGAGAGSNIKVIDLRRHSLRIAGTARDSGGGSVAAVEVSLDGGTTWRLANGTNSWVFLFPKQRDFFSAFCSAAGHPGASAGRHAFPLPPPAAVRSVEGGATGLRFAVTVLSRAVDDSGWLESVDRSEREERSGAKARGNNNNNSSSAVHATRPSRAPRLLGVVGSESHTRHHPAGSRHHSSSSSSHSRSNQVEVEIIVPYFPAPASKD